MITHLVGWAQVVDGKWSEAIEWHKEGTAILEAKDWATSLFLQPQYDDQTDYMVLVWEFETLADYEEWTETIHADADVQESIRRMELIFVPESMSFFAYKGMSETRFLMESRSVSTYEIGWAQVADGKWNEAMEWHREGTAYFEANGWTTALTLQPQYDGETDYMVWIFEFESLANYEKWYETIHADAGVQESIRRMESIFVPKSMNFFPYKGVQ